MAAKELQMNGFAKFHRHVFISFVNDNNCFVKHTETLTKKLTLWKYTYMYFYTSIYLGNDILKFPQRVYISTLYNKPTQPHSFTASCLYKSLGTCRYQTPMKHNNTLELKFLTLT